MYVYVDKHFDFNTDMNKLLDQEVEKRLEVKVNGYYAALEQEKEATQKQYEQETTIRELERQLREAKKTFVKQGADQTKRELMGGFKLGDEVWFVRREHKYIPCEMCSGKGKLKAKAIEVPEPFKINCLNCKGYGEKSNYEYSVAQGIICEIKIHTWAREQCFESTFYIEPTSYRANDSVQREHSKIFHTEEECQKAINDILNPPTSAEK
ncbi:hypothetical protein [Brevibacillus laterosporus]|uniref:hypothetical protein n=1 Tax=Brevibacillus laterosporus TaxID=1465 RepID=UPI002E1F8434|nr:hypothetical protein [Brevibacillus laterosporus]MED1667242.1 hypothetical protein [Brevibacillus laterosporus]MED1719690.1 hypothetical protein [Brevibacillus laterosporus]